MTSFPRHRATYSSVEGRRGLKARDELRCAVDRQFEEAFENIAVDKSLLTKPAFCPAGISRTRLKGPDAPKPF
jgi:hypothetical protein